MEAQNKDPNAANWHAEQNEQITAEVAPQPFQPPAPGEPGSRENPIVVKNTDTNGNYGGYTGRRMSQMPGALYQPGMPIRIDSLTHPKEGDPQVPLLHETGDPRLQEPK
jgi:hypothetical protein